VKCSFAPLQPTTLLRFTISIICIFAGQPFTKSRRALFDDKLKARIDAFVLGLGCTFQTNKALSSVDVVVATTSSSKIIHDDDQETSAKKRKIELSSDAGEEEFNFGGKDLDSLLNQALSGRESILGQNLKKLKKCLNCEKDLKEVDGGLYFFQCNCPQKLFLCRDCLVHLSSGTCQMCSKSWTHRDFCKYHTTQSTSS
jgi:hypothetical protein